MVATVHLFARHKVHPFAEQVLGRVCAGDGQTTDHTETENCHSIVEEVRQ